MTVIAVSIQTRTVRIVGPQKHCSIPRTRSTGVFINKQWQALPDTTLADWAILSMIESLSANRSVSVAHLARMIGQDRTTTSRRITRLTNLGYLTHTTLSENRIHLAITAKCQQLIHQAEQENAAPVAINDQLEPEAKQPEPESKQPEHQRIRGCDNMSRGCDKNSHYKRKIKENGKVSNNRPADFVEHFSDNWEKSGQPHDLLTDAVADYFDYCQDRRATPTRTGCRALLMAKADQQRRAAMARDAAQRKTEATADKLVALALKDQQIADRVHSDNIARLAATGPTGYHNDRSWAVGQ